MLNPAQGQRLKIFILCGVGLLVAVVVGSNIGSSNYGYLVLGVIGVVGFFIVFFMGRFFWVLTIASSFLAGTFPVLGGSFTPFQILMAIGVAKFLVEDVVLKRTRLQMGKRFDLLLIAGFMAILTWHGIHDRFGMKFLGSSVWGGRNYVNVFVGLAAFVVIQSVRMPNEAWKKLPYLILAVTSFDLLIAIITTIFPASIYKIYPFYSAVSMAGVEEIVTGESGTGRIGSVGNFGFILVLLILASKSLRRILQPGNLGRLFGLAIGSSAALFSGFRTQVANTVIAFTAAGIRDLRQGVLFLLPLLAILLFAISVINSEFVRLPRQMQRAISFLPGKWDSEMAEDAAGSNEFRRRMWNLWEEQYFPVHPWLGRGFGFKSEWAKQSRINPLGIDYRQNVEVGNIHNGLFAALDGFGIIGAIFFAMWLLRILFRALRVPFHEDAPTGITLRFVALYLIVWIVTYWFGAETVGLFLPTQFALTAVLLRLQAEQAPSSGTRRAAEVQPPVGRQLVRS